MLTPQDIHEVKFIKSVKGYDKDQVEEFLNLVYNDYAALYKENATLKNKMRVLVDKIEEYRSVDEQMRKTFYSAQVTAQETVAKAQAEADALLQTARQEADDILQNARGDAEMQANDLRRQIQVEEKRLEMAKEESRQYIMDIRKMISGNLDMFEELADRMDIKIDQEPVDAPVVGGFDTYDHSDIMIDIDPSFPDPTADDHINVGFSAGDIDPMAAPEQTYAMEEAHRADMSDMGIPASPMAEGMPAPGTHESGEGSGDEVGDPHSTFDFSRMIFGKGPENQE